MGGPKSADILTQVESIPGSNLFLAPYNILPKGMKNSAKDVIGGAEDILKGKMSKGLSSMVAGNVGLLTMGLSQDVLPGRTLLAEKAGAGGEQPAAPVEDPEKAARLLRIQNRLSEEIRLRQKTPGKAQTLLTTTLTPTSQSTGTLLTGAAR